MIIPTWTFLFLRGVKGGALLRPAFTALTCWTRLPPDGSYSLFLMDCGDMDCVGAPVKSSGNNHGLARILLKVFPSV